MFFHHICRNWINASCKNIFKLKRYEKKENVKRKIKWKSLLLRIGAPISLNSIPVFMKENSIIYEASLNAKIFLRGLYIFLLCDL
jgi:hypothetical protein